MVKWKDQENEFPFEGEGDHYDNEARTTEEEKEYTEKDLPPYYEDLLYEEWRDKQMRKKSEAHQV